MKPFRNTNQPTYPANRSGFTVTEMLVSALLLISVMSLVGPLAVRTGRLWQQTRHGRLALEELSNQLDRLTHLSADKRTVALAKLAPTQSIRVALSNPQLSAKTIHDQDGQRLVLQLTWDRAGAPGKLSLTGWLKEI